METQKKNFQNIYISKLNPHYGRLLSSLDTETTSISKGSFDRTWWCWKFTDFSASRFQEGAYFLAWLSTSALSPINDNKKYYFLELTLSSILFWQKLQHKDGSFDEAYPYERSFAATAFTSFYISCSIERIKKNIPYKDLNNILKSLEKAGLWLSRNVENHGILSNHLAAAAAALQVIYELTGDTKFISAKNKYLDIIYCNQHSSEGWLKEYGGADPGYQTHAMFYLAEIERRTNDPKLLNSLSKATDFISWFVNPDGSYGGEFASRGTKFVFPAAFEILSEKIPLAAGIATYNRKLLRKNLGVWVQHMDVWNQFPMFNNYLFAAENVKVIKEYKKIPLQKLNIRKIYKDAGLIVYKKNKQILYCGTKMGGTIKIYNMNGNLFYEDCGYYVKNLKNFATSQNSFHYEIKQIAKKGLFIKIHSNFNLMSKQRFTSLKFILFRIFTITIGRNPFFSKLVKNFLVYILINKKTKFKGKLIREVSVSDDNIVKIDDKIYDSLIKPQPMVRGLPFHMGSSRYGSLDDFMLAEQNLEAPVKEKNFYNRIVNFTLN